MKPSPRTFRIEWDLHAWVGVLLSLGLFVIFYFGVFALFRSELSVWQGSERPSSRRAACEVSWDQRLKYLDRYLALPAGARFRMTPSLDACSVKGWRFGAGEPQEREAVVDTQTGRLLSARSRLADELYYMHFIYRVPGGLELSGFLALGLLCLVITGFVIHWQKLRRQWWQFRPQLRLRVSASDAHKVLSVFGAPFVVMFAWSGAVLGLGAHFVSLFADTMYGGDEPRVSALFYGAEVTGKASDHSTAWLSLDALVREARLATPGSGEVELVEGDQFRRVGGSLRVVFTRAGLDNQRSIVLDAASGKMLGTNVDETTPSSAFNFILYDLHFADYGGPLVRWLYAILSLAACVVIITGNIVWVERRDPQRKTLGNRWLERATVGVASGANAAAATYFCSNRLLPESWLERASLEFAAFLAVWVACTGAVLLARRGARRAGGRASTLAGGLYAATLLFELVSIDWRSLPPARAIVVSDALLVLLMLASFGIAWLLRERRQRPAAPSTRTARFALGGPRATRAAR